MLYKKKPPKIIWVFALIFLPLHLTEAFQNVNDLFIFPQRYGISVK